MEAKRQAQLSKAQTELETSEIKLKMVRDGNVTTHVVREPCDNKTNGHWYCATHQTHAANNFEAHDGPECKQVWL